MSVRVALALALAAMPRVGSADPGEKSEGVAIALTAGGTLVGIFATVPGFSELALGATSASPELVLGMTAAAVLPSAGQWYAGNVAGWGLAPRTLGIVGISLAAWGYETRRLHHPDDMTIGGASVVAYAAGAVIDGVTSARAVRRHNERRRAMNVAPTVLHPPSGPVIGIALAGRF
jgi:hypothetical protein